MSRQSNRLLSVHDVLPPSTALAASPPSIPCPLLSSALFFFLQDLRHRQVSPKFHLLTPFSGRNFIRRLFSVPGRAFPSFRRRSSSTESWKLPSMLWRELAASASMYVSFSSHFPINLHVSLQECEGISPFLFFIWGAKRPISSKVLFFF